MRNLHIVLGCLLALACSGGVKLSNQDPVSFLPSSIYYHLEEETERNPFSPANVNQVDVLTKTWTQGKRTNLSFGFTSKTLWLFVEGFNPSEEESLVLELGNPHLDEVSVYEAGETLPFKKTGDMTPHSEWEVASKSVAVLVPWEPKTTKRFFVKIRTTSSIYLALQYHTIRAFERKENKENAIIGFFYGTIVIMVIYNLFIYFLLKDQAYILYSFSILGNLLIQSFLNGVSNQIFTPFDPMIHNRLGAVFVCISAVFGWSFAITFLNTKRTAPKLYRYIRILILIVLVYLLLVINVLSLRFVVRYSQIVAQIFVFSVFLLAIHSVRKGNRQAKLFLFGWTLLLIGILLFTFMQSGLVPGNWITIYSNQIGSTLEAGVLSLALADKINQLKEEKAKAQKEALVTLEEKVQNRTKELNQSLLTIRKDLNVAKKIQQNLFQPVRITDNRIEFESFFRSMSEVGGDFYDISQIDRDLFRLCVADATGHGIQAALITMAIKSEYESLKGVHDSPGELLSHLNRIFFHKYSMLQTIFTCAILDIDFKSKSLRFASAGHPDQIWISQNKIKILGRTGRIIGMAANSEYSQIEHNFSAMDRIFLFTDGLFEVFNPKKEMFGESRLQNILLTKTGLHLQDTVRTTLEALEKFQEEESFLDDITLVSLEIKTEIYAS